jgi:hypothetical protein
MLNTCGQGSLFLAADRGTCYTRRTRHLEVVCHSHMAKDERDCASCAAAITMPPFIVSQRFIWSECCSIPQMMLSKSTAQRPPFEREQ